MPYGWDDDPQARAEELDLDLGMGPPKPAPVATIQDASKDQIAVELLRRGVDPSHIDQAGFGHVTRQWRAGLIGPSLNAPDATAARQAYMRDYDKLSKSREVLSTRSPDMSALQRFRQLNRVQATGGLQHQPIDEKTKWFDLPGHALNLARSVQALDPEFQEMSGIASTLQGKARPEGSGATSDFEQRLYRMGVPSPEKRPEVNASIIAHMKGVHAEESDRTAFEDEFIKRNGSLSGSQEAWQRYLQANPYVRNGSNGRLEENARRTAWREYFGLEDVKVPPVASRVARSAYDAARPAFLKAYAARTGSARGGAEAFDQWWSRQGAEVVRDGLKRMSAGSRPGQTATKPKAGGGGDGFGYLGTVD